MRIVVQNVQKRNHLCGDLIKEYDPDVALIPKVNLPSEDAIYFGVANFVSSLGYGTAIYSKTTPATNVRHIKSPHADAGGFIHKKTVVAICPYTVKYLPEIECVSFHGYNGQPRKRVLLSR